MLFQVREERPFDSVTADKLLNDAQEELKALRSREAAVATRLREVVSK